MRVVGLRGRPDSAVVQSVFSETGWEGAWKLISRAWYSRVAGEGLGLGFV